MNDPAPYFHWGFILISLPNLVLIGVMVLLFIVALFAPFPGARHRRTAMTSDAMSGPPPGALAGGRPRPSPAGPRRSAGAWRKTLPLTELLPTRQPAYIGSWVYAFGVITIAALFWVVLSGVRAGVLRLCLVAHLRRSGNSSTASTSGPSRCSSSSWCSTSGVSTGARDGATAAPPRG